MKSDWFIFRTVSLARPVCFFISHFAVSFVFAISFVYLIWELWRIHKMKCFWKSVCFSWKSGIQNLVQNCTQFADIFFDNSMYSMNEDKYFMVVCVELCGIEKGNKMVNIMWILVLNRWEAYFTKGQVDASSAFNDYDKWFNGVHWRGQHIHIHARQNTNRDTNGNETKIKINNNIINTTIKPLELVFYWNEFNKSNTNTNTHTIPKLIVECIGFISSLLTSNIRKIHFDAANAGWFCWNDMCLSEWLDTSNAQDIWALFVCSRNWGFFVLLGIIIQ